MTSANCKRYGIDEYAFAERAGIYQYEAGFDLKTAELMAFNDLNEKKIHCKNMNEFVKLLTG